MDLSGPGIDVKLKERKKERKTLEKIKISPFFRKMKILSQKHTKNFVPVLDDIKITWMDERLVPRG
jgi:hypothetical protein